MNWNVSISVHSNVKIRFYDGKKIGSSPAARASFIPICGSSPAPARMPSFPKLKNRHSEEEVADEVVEDDSPEPLFL